MTIAILATGDEIVHGDTLNSNGRELASLLSSEGFSLGFHVACSDKERDIQAALQFLAPQHDIIILIGGLGPTSDDCTRFAVAQWTGELLVQHPEALVHVEHRLIAAGVAMNAGNLQQCLFPANAKLLPNPHGSAVGCYYPWQGKTLVLLPGPPRECLPMFINHVMPLLRQTVRSPKHIVKWRIFGLAESEIADTLEHALAHIECQTGYRLDVPYIEFKVRCAENLVTTVKSIIDPILAPHCITLHDKKASETLCDTIQAMEEPITIIDEATGGLLQTFLSKPGMHDRLHFHTRGNTPLSFHCYGLAEYWNKEPATGKTQLTIDYANAKQEGRETHTLPYRSPLVTYYAAEFLSFRLFHLINQLHQ